MRCLLDWEYKLGTEEDEGLVLRDLPRQRTWKPGFLKPLSSKKKKWHQCSCSEMLWNFDGKDMLCHWCRWNNERIDWVRKGGIHARKCYRCYVAADRGKRELSSLRDHGGRTAYSNKLWDTVSVMPVIFARKHCLSKYSGMRIVTEFPSATVGKDMYVMVHGTVPE